MTPSPRPAAASRAASGGGGGDFGFDLPTDPVSLYRYAATLVFVLFTLGVLLVVLATERKR